MHTRAFLFSLAILLLAGCATTTEDRIAKHREEFARLPTEVQQAVRIGKIEVGYSEAAVLIALGEPKRRVERRDADGQTDVWIYGRRGPQFSFGFGVSGGSHHSAVGVGVDATLPRRGEDDDEAMRVEFRGGRVVNFEYRKG